MVPRGEGIEENEIKGMNGTVHCRIGFSMVCAVCRNMIDNDTWSGDMPQLYGSLICVRLVARH